MRGGKRPGAGKKKGGANVITTQMRFDILATLRSRGVDPLERLLWCYDEAKKLYKEAREDHVVKSTGEHTQNHWLVNSRLQMMLNASQELMEYVYPKRKAIEITGAGGESLFEAFVDMVKQVQTEVKNSSAIETKSHGID